MLTVVLPEEGTLTEFFLVLREPLLASVFPRPAGVKSPWFSKLQRAWVPPPGTDTCSGL